MDDSGYCFRGRYLGIRERDGWEYATRTNASAVVILVPVTDAGELVLVEQYRVPVQCRVIELPAGLVGDQGEPEETLLDAARRELEEETGFTAGRLSRLLTCPSSAGMSDEMITFYLAEGLARTGPGGGDDSESITVHLVPVDEVVAWLAGMMEAGRLVDPKTYGALHWLARRREGMDPLS